MTGTDKVHSYYIAKVLATVGITDKRLQNEINLALTVIPSLSCHQSADRARLANSWLQCWNLITGVSSAFLSKILKRRTQYLIAFIGMTCCFAIWTGVSADYAQTANNQAASAVGEC
jgi:hypothetical protein